MVNGIVIGLELHRFKNGAYLLPAPGDGGIVGIEKIGIEQAAGVVDILLTLVPETCRQAASLRGGITYLSANFTGLEIGRYDCFAAVFKVVSRAPGGVYLVTQFFEFT